MKDINVMIDEYGFNFRVCALIENNGRYLLEYSDTVDFLNLPGGRVKIFEDTLAAIKRELKEELNLDGVEPKLLQVSEQFYEFRGKRVHELNYAYYIYLDDSHPLTKADNIKNLDSNNQYLKWIEVEHLKDHKIIPTFIYDLKYDDKITHYIKHEV